MSIRNFFLLLCVLAAMAACGSSNKKVSAAGDGPDGAGASAGPSSAARVTGQETASGELRDALLALRRVHFALDTAELTAESRAALADAATKLARHPDVHLYVDGHTDERGTTEYNIGLGERRARAVTEYLSRSGVAAERLHVVSFGKEQPLAAGHDAAAWAENRRVDFRLMRGSVRLVLEASTPVDDDGKPLPINAAAPR